MLNVCEHGMHAIMLPMLGLAAEQIHVANWMSASGIVLNVNLTISISMNTCMPVQVVVDVFGDVQGRLT